ncbi:hypothetical protein BB561_001138 [Smittium simulii]|uniref:Uncharacterized protein n=1 Tax=Smittium simulii TaxID=133385 RepID=A0A2T9YW26_9FUNG|nr:hypothetical protein BB561_001138 [Smittium simulii]
MKTLLDLPYEILEEIIIRAANPVVFQVNKKFATFFLGSSLYVKKRFVYEQANGDPLAGLQTLLKKKILEVSLIDSFLYDILYTVVSTQPKGRGALPFIKKKPVPGSIQQCFELYSSGKSKKRNRKAYARPFCLENGQELGLKLNWRKKFKALFTNFSLPMWIFKRNQKYVEKIDNYYSLLQKLERNHIKGKLIFNSCSTCYYNFTKSFPYIPVLDKCTFCFNHKQNLTASKLPCGNFASENTIKLLNLSNTSKINKSKRCSDHINYSINCEENQMKRLKKSKPNETSSDLNLLPQDITGDFQPNHPFIFGNPTRLNATTYNIDFKNTSSDHFTKHISSGCYTNLCEDNGLEIFCTTCKKPPMTRRATLNEENLRLLDIVYHLLALGIPATSHKGLPLINSVINKNTDMLLMRNNIMPDSNTLKIMAGF